MESEKTMTTGPKAVVWMPQGVQPPAELLTALAKGNLGIERVTSPYAALAHLCRHGRGASQDAKTASAALVLVSPEKLVNPGQVCDAAARYAPHTRLWMYDPGPNQRLRAVVQDDVDSWLKSPGSIDARPVVLAKVPGPGPGRPGALSKPPAAKDSRTVAPIGGPKLRLAGDGQVQEPAQSAEQQDAAQGSPAPRQVLTAEELEMLLDDGEPKP
jgi:hypothetical protein